MLLLLLLLEVEVEPAYERERLLKCTIQCIVCSRVFVTWQQRGAPREYHVLHEVPLDGLVTQREGFQHLVHDPCRRGLLVVHQKGFSAIGEHCNVLKKEEREEAGDRRRGRQRGAM